MNQETLKELLVDQIRDLYDAEKQLVKALPKLAKAADSEELGNALRTHLAETQNHVARLEKVFKSIGAPVKGKPCKGMQGLVEEGGEAVQEKEEGPARDLAIVAGGQKVEHYEMSAYGTARALACLSQLGSSAAGKPFRISGGVQKVSTTKWVCVLGESSWSHQAVRSFAMRS